MKDINPDIEKSLIKELVLGNQRSFKLIFDQYYVWLYNYVHKLSNDRKLSEDLVQNVFLKLWEKKSSLQINASLKSYLFAACHNEFLMHLRAQKRVVDMLEDLRFEALTELYIEKDENVQEMNWSRIESAVELLPKKCREVFKLSRFERKRHKEIAKILGISTKTVEIHITKALRFLKTNVSTFLF